MDRHDIFLGLKQHCVYCINDTHTKELILPPGAYAFCSITCEVLSNFKIDFHNERCLDSCEKSDNTKYDYKDVCYLNCPENTLMLGYLCIDTTSAEFDEYNIEYDDEIKPIGYYQDTDEVYKKCYETCKYCNGAGTEEINNCRVCKDNTRTLTDFENDDNCYQICEHYYYFDEHKKYHCT
jgi:hypothetical protein